MNKILYLTCTIVILFSNSCVPEVVSCFPIKINENKKLSIEQNYTCIIMPTPSLIGSNISSKNHKKLGSKGIVAKNTKWNNGETIRVKFLNGDPCLHEIVKKYALEWTEYANLKLEFVNSNEIADIKINIDSDITKFNGSSYLGTDCRKLPQDQPTMHLSLNQYKPGIILRQLVLHEFGHAFGLHHEHQHPNSTLNWNEEVVYNWYMLINNYTKEEVETSVLKKFEKTDENIFYSDEYDQKSIMHYYVLPFLTTDFKGVPLNTKLSDNDKKIISDMYPNTMNPL